MSSVAAPSVGWGGCIEDGIDAVPVAPNSIGCGTPYIPAGCELMLKGDVICGAIMPVGCDAKPPVGT